MTFYDIDTFNIEDYPKTDKNQTKVLIDMMNDYARLSLNAVDGQPQSSGGSYDFGYEKYYAEKYGEYKAPDVAMKKIAEYVSNNKDMVDPCLNMFDRLQKITAYSNASSINEMMYAMGDICEAFPQHATECKIRVLKYTREFFEGVGQLPAQRSNSNMLLSTRQFIRSKLDVESPEPLADGTKVAKQNRFMRLMRLKKRGKS